MAYKKKITWISKISEIDSNPSIFIANEFFDAMPTKQCILNEIKVLCADDLRP